MKIKRFMCDRCRHDFPLERKRRMFRVILRSGNGDPAENMWGRRTMELCTECEGSFRTWLATVSPTNGTGSGHGAAVAPTPIAEGKPAVASDYRLVVNRPAPPSSAGKSTQPKVESRVVRFAETRVEGQAIKVEPKEETK